MTYPNASDEEKAFTQRVYDSLRRKPKILHIWDATGECRGVGCHGEIVEAHGLSDYGLADDLFDGEIGE